VAVPEVFAGMMGGTLNADHVRANWDEALRLAVSVGSGHVAAYPRQNGLAVALREIGRLERTLFNLDWFHSSDLYRRANAGLNKGEARNALACAVFFHRLSELRDRSFESQACRASGLNLLVVAIFLWNTRYLQAAFDALRARCHPIPPELGRHVALLGWEHVGLTGGYVWPPRPSPPPARSGRCATGRRCWPHRFPLRSREPDTQRIRLCAFHGDGRSGADPECRL
jgi:hypothetical protein